MRKLTIDEKVFVAGVGTAAVVGTIEVVPKVIAEIGKVHHEVKKPTTGDVFASGFAVGAVTGVVLATKVIMDKVNNP